MRKFIGVSISIAIGILNMPAWAYDETINPVTSDPRPIVEEQQSNPDLKAQNTDTSTKPEESPEEGAYKEAMIKLSDAINQKINEIEAKRKELDNEIYPAYQPPLRAELNELQQQLQELNMQREQLKAQKASRDMTKELQSNP